MGEQVTRPSLTRPVTVLFASQALKLATNFLLAGVSIDSK